MQGLHTLHSLTYRPGWSFAWVDPHTVRISWTAPNSMPGATDDIELYVDCDVTGMDLSGALHAIMDRIAGIEDHERSEWLRWRGRCVSREARRAHPGLYEPADLDGARLELGEEWYCATQDAHIWAGMDGGRWCTRCGAIVTDGG